MDKERYFKEFLRTVTVCSQMSDFDKIFKYPTVMVEFFEMIYNDGYAAGHKEGEIVKENKIMRKN